MSNVLWYSSDVRHWHVTINRKQLDAKKGKSDGQISKLKK